MKSPPPWDAARGIFPYEGPVRDLIHNLKFRKKTSALRALSWLSAKKVTIFLEEFGPIDMAVPMPVSTRRLRERGFNQCVDLAKRIFGPVGLDLAYAALKKTRDTPPQTGLSREERARNVRGVFRADKVRVSGKRVLLFDDVFTTGATCMEATQCLKGAGAQKVFVLTVARTVNK